VLDDLASTSMGTSWLCSVALLATSITRPAMARSGRPPILENAST
jgi:hypothetical protein